MCDEANDLRGKILNAEEEMKGKGPSGMPMTPVDFKLQAWKDAISLNVHPSDRGMFETLKIGLLCAKPDLLVQSIFSAQNKGHTEEARLLYARLQELRFNELQNSNTEIPGGYSSSMERVRAKEEGFDYLMLGERAHAPEAHVLGFVGDPLNGAQTTIDQPHSGKRLWPEVALQESSRSSARSHRSSRTTLGSLLGVTGSAQDRKPTLHDVELSFQHKPKRSIHDYGDISLLQGQPSLDDLNAMLAATPGKSVGNSAKDEKKASLAPTPSPPGEGEGWEVDSDHSFSSSAASPATQMLDSSNADSSVMDEAAGVKPFKSQGFLAG